MNTSKFHTTGKLTIAILLFLSTLFIALLAGGCKKPTPAPSAPETGTMTDRDGNVYGTVKIGNQWWMAQDLKVRTYQNGDKVILKDSTAGITWKDTSAGCCYINLSIGVLYNWYAVNDSRVLIPAGWHLPSDQEWKILETQLGMSSADVEKVNWRGGDEGDMLKRKKEATSISGAWQDSYDVYTIWPNNQSGFTALAGSCRIFNGLWSDTGIGDTGFWWSSSLAPAPHQAQAWYRYLDYNKGNIFRFYGDKRYGFSIRCVRD
jgi:uncharacterized protein (TIGR02145 family)